MITRTYGRADCDGGAEIGRRPARATEGVRTVRRLIVVVGLLGAAATLTMAVGEVAAIAAPAATHWALAGCTPKITKIKGHTAVVNCGPATATLHVGGKTYTFKNGTCAVRANGLPLVQLGTGVLGVKNNGGYPLFQLEGLTKDDTTVSADSGSLHLSALLGKSSGNGKHGNITFSGHTGDRSVSFSGSVNCHGFVRKTN